MSQRRDIEARLALYDDLSGIIGAMRSFALTELQRVTRREEAQRQVLQSVSEALDDLAPTLSAPAKTAGDIWLLFGSVRGFCGSFNEDVLQAWQQGGGSHCPTVVVGERLAGMMPAQSRRYCVSGAESSLDASSAIDRIMAELTAARSETPSLTGLMAVLGDDGGAQMIRLLPLRARHAARGGVLPLTHAAPAQVATQVAEHYLFHSLLAALLRAIRGENRMRLMQMDNALRHLERGQEDFHRERNRLRQEEIVEEIELMAGHAAGDAGEQLRSA